MRNVRVPVRASSGLAFLLAMTALGISGCQGPERPELRVAAASDLVLAMPELAEAFEQETGIRVVPVLGSSGQLARQIGQGAPYDLFLSANHEYVRRLADSGAILPESVRSYAVGPLVLAYPSSATHHPSGLASLADPQVRAIALANPDHAPYGRAGKQVLERAGLWDELEPKVVFGQSIQNAAQFVKSGQADAGLLARSLADVPELRWEPIDPGLHEPVEQYLGVVSGSRQQASALAFAGLLVGERGQRILRRHGFEPARSAILAGR